MDYGVSKVFLNLGRLGFSTYNNIEARCMNCFSLKLPH
jgi:hypothetical protein